MPPRRYRFHGERVLQEIEAAPIDVRRAFSKLLEGLRDHPHPLPGKAVLGVLPLKDQAPSMYTAPFDDGLLVYQVMSDHPIIKLVQVSWLS